MFMSFNIYQLIITRYFHLILEFEVKLLLQFKQMIDIKLEQTQNLKGQISDAWNDHQTSIFKILKTHVSFEKPSFIVPLHQSILSFLQNTNSCGYRALKVNQSRDEEPLSTNSCVSLNLNVRVVDSVPLVYDNMTPQSIVTNPYTTHNKIIDGLQQKIHQLQSQNRAHFNPQEIGFLRKICQAISLNCSGYESLQSLAKLSQLLRKEPTTIIKHFASLYRSNFPTQQEYLSTKQFFYGSADQYCNICHLYICSTHYSEQVIIINELFKSSDKDAALLLSNNSPYEGRAKPNNEAMRRISEDSLISTFRCGRQGCTSNGEKQTSVLKLKKFQRHWIDIICGYGVHNPCTIAKILHNNIYSITCTAVKYFLSANLYLRKPFAQRSQLTPFTKKRAQPNPKFAHREDLIVPCFHEDSCGSNECHCERCFKFCCCPPTCSKRIWCDCSDCGLEDNGRFLCPCRSKKIECDPDACGCPSKQQDLSSTSRTQRQLSCLNSAVTFGVSPRLVLSKSLICEGLGVFAGQDFDKFDYVGEYRGVILDENQSSYVEQLDQITGQHYLFVLNAEEQVDGKRMGNKTRYVNHALPPVANCDCQVVVVNGNYKVQMFTKRPVFLGEELFFDYSEEFKTDWKQSFDKRSQQYFKTKGK